MDKDRREKTDSESIQRGLEDFLDKELDLSLAESRRREPDLSLAPRGREPDLSLAKGRREPDVRSASPGGEPDLSLAPQRKEPEPPLSPHRPRAQQTQALRAGGEGSEAERRERRRTESHADDERDAEMMRAIRKSQDRNKKRAAGESKRRDGGKKDKDRMPAGRSGAAKKGGAKKSGKKGGGNGNDAGKGKKNGLWKALAVLVVLLLVFGVGIYCLVGSLYGKMNYEEAGEFAKESMKEDGVINVLLIGNDSRLAGEDGRSDAMILVSISDKTRTITMTSLLRDMYVEIPGHDGNRLNAAYSYGGPELLMETIELNFDIPVHRYALVNFQAFANLVDAVGGIDLELSNEEVQLVNGYLMEYNQLEGKDLATDFIDPAASGMLHLNGPQALAYTRNRYIGTDFGRTERQRKVLAEVFQKLPASALSNGGELADGLFPNLTTNLKQSECYSLSLNAWKIVGYKMVQQAVPVEGSYSDADIRGMAVLQVDFETNKRFLKSTLYGEE